jgi:hypothetical protein
MPLRCFGTERRSELPFTTSVVTTGAVYEVLFRGRSTSSEKSENEICLTHVGEHPRHVFHSVLSPGNPP